MSTWKKCRRKSKVNPGGDCFYQPRNRDGFAMADLMYNERSSRILKQRELGDMSGMSQTTIDRMEHTPDKKMNLKTYQKVMNKMLEPEGLRIRVEQIFVTEIEEIDVI